VLAEGEHYEVLMAHDYPACLSCDVPDDDDPVWNTWAAVDAAKELREQRRAARKAA
jgi:hypothetical protein